MTSEIIHMRRWRTYTAIAPYKHRVKELGYLCNGACGITKSKLTSDISKVTCKNCTEIWGRGVLE